MPEGYWWTVFDVAKDSEVEEICKFLTNHYMTAPGELFVVACEKSKFLWALKTPGYNKDLHFMIRNSHNELVGIITAVPRKFQIVNQTKSMATVNFLAVHSNHREKGLAKCLMIELERRLRKVGYHQAFFSTSHPIPTPLCQTTYTNRLINAKKLHEVGFCTHEAIY